MKTSNVNFIALFFILILFSCFTIISCDPVGDPDPDPEGGDDIMRDWTLNDHGDVWRLSSVERLDCTISGDNAYLDYFSQSPCQAARDGFCFYTTLCFSPTGNYLFTDQSYDEFDQTFYERGTYSLGDNTITFCVDGAGSCQSPKEIRHLTNTATGEALLIIKEVNGNFGNGTCTVISTYVKIEDFPCDAVSYFPFDGNANDLNEYCDIDEEGTNNEYRSGQKGQALVCNGKDTRIIYNKGSFSNSQNFSVSCWYMDQVNDGALHFVTCNEFTIVTSQSNASFTVPIIKENTATPGTDGTEGGINTSLWNHVVGTCNGAEVRLYVNGELADRYELGNNALREDNIPLSIGFHSQTNLPWTGIIDDLYIFDRELSENEIRALYEN